MQTQLARWLIGLILVASAVAVSLSPLNRQCALPSWGAVAVGATLALVISRRYTERILHLGQHLLHPGQTNTSSQTNFGPLDLAMLSTIASATTQALVAVDLPSPRYLAIHNTPGIHAFYFFLAFVVSFVHVMLAIDQGDRGRSLAALLAAGLFGSTLYLRSLSAPEAGPVYGPILGLTLLAAWTFWNSRIPSNHTVLGHRSNHKIALLSLLFLAAVALAAFFSPVPRQSLDLWLRLVTLIVLMALLSLSIDTPQTWQTVAWVVVISAGILPILPACLKFISLIRPFGLIGALSYRLHPNEFGGANLVARSILCVVPLSLTLAGQKHRRARHWMAMATIAFGAGAMLYSRSWEGFFALLLSLGAYGIGAYWQNIERIRQRLAVSSLSRWLMKAGIVATVALSIILLIQAAQQLNIYSFNGRLIHWHGALLAWQDHIWLGGGPGNDIVYVPYADQVGIFVDTQVTYDDPLTSILIHAGRSLRAHAHNLFLSLGATTGLLGVFAFGLLVASILVIGLRAWRRSDRDLRVWIAGCLAGIAGALAWGILDVLWVTPPFFSFPVWALIGLLLAASRFAPAGDQKQIPKSVDGTANAGHRWSGLVPWSLAILALLLVLLPAVASVHYAAGFVALQEQRWSESASHLEAALHYGGPDLQPYHLLADAYLAQGKTEEAEQAYRQAANLKQGSSFYLSQLGWLAWLRGDLDKGTEYFEQAIHQDPAEIGRNGLHAGLGMAYAAQGHDRQARSVLADAVQLDPASATDSTWLPVVDKSSTVTTVLDPAYLQGPSPELDKRILAHLGAPDITERLFRPTGTISSPIALCDVLDTIEADYHQAAAEGRRQASLLLAALAEASRQAGFDQRAEQAYLEFQALQPGSAYGFRDLGLLYRQQGRLEEAQAVLEQAVTVSPRDFDSRYQLALVYMDRQMWTAAEQALDTITLQAQTTLFHSRLFDPDLHSTISRLRLAQGNLQGAIEAQRRVVLIRAQPEDHLTLADLYWQADQKTKRTETCLAAARSHLRTWPRPLDPLLWDIGTCLSQASDDQVPSEIADQARAHSLAGNVLLGHLHRARGEQALALEAYQAAAAARPDEGGPHYFLGETHQALGQADLAEAEYRRAAELDPLESLPLLALGRLQWSQGRQADALDSFQAAVETTPGWGEAQVALGNALLALGDQVGAAKHYHQAQLADRDLPQDLAYDFAAELGSAEIKAPGPGYVRNDYATLDGQRQRVLFVHPDSKVRYAVQVPAEAKLVFDVGTLAESWDRPGDGVRFALHVESGGNTKRLFSAYIDPKQRSGDRRWQPFTLDLSAYADQTVTLVFETDSGPAGDNRYDWAVWARPRLLAP